MNDNTNITRIRAVHNALEEMADKVVFVGGATVSLYKDRPASETRVTDDVDIVVEIASYSEYGKVEDQLRKKGFINDVESNVICRYKINGIIVDVMPTEENILGFKNKWYSEGYRNAVNYPVSERQEVKLFSSIYFLASKIDAFKDRGSEDGRTSQDFEDIVYILNNRNTIWAEMEDAEETVKEYLKDEFRKLLNQKYLYEWISCHLDYVERNRTSMIIDKLKAFCNT